MKVFHLKKNLFGSRRGFTLLEVLIVLVVLGILAGLSVPMITDQIERSRATEAIQHLDAVSDRMKVYRGFNGTYTGVAADFSNLNYNPNTPAAGQIPLFSYALSNLTANTYTCTAQREPVANNAGNTVVLNHNFAANPQTVVTRNGVYQ